MDTVVGLVTSAVTCSISSTSEFRFEYTTLSFPELASEFENVLYWLILVIVQDNDILLLHSYILNLFQYHPYLMYPSSNLCFRNSNIIKH